MGGPVSGEADLELVVRSSGRVVPMPARRFAVGTDPACEVRLEERTLLPRHAELSCDDAGRWTVRCASEGARVAVNGHAVLEAAFGAASVLRLGDVELLVRSVGAATGAFSAVDADGTGPLPTSSGPPPAAAPAPRARNEGELAPGTVIDGRYRVLDCVAAGGMGAVYRAEHVELGRLFALKVTLPELSAQPSFIARFKREAMVASRAGQQNIVTISDMGTLADGRFYFAMEYVAGVTLRQALKRDGAFPAQRAVGVALQVARALAAVHGQGVVHRDLKPENVMLVDRPRQPDFVKVVDFGLAKEVTPGGAALTAAGVLLGTPRYMSPEQAMGLPVDGRADLYSLGLLLYELLEGAPPFRATRVQDLLLEQVTAPPPPLTRAHGGPPELDALVMQLLEKDAARRPADASEVVARLERLAASAGWPRPSSPRPMSATPPLAASSPSPAATLAPINPTLPGPAPGPRPTPASPTAAETRLVPHAGATVPLAAAPKAVHAEGPPHTPAPARASSAADASSATPESPAAPVSPAARAPGSSPLLRWLVLALAGAAVLAVGLVVGARLRAPEAAPAVEKPATAPAPRQAPVEAPTPAAVPGPSVRLSFEAVPAQVDVLLGDVLIGQTPLSLTRPQGELLQLTFAQAGYEPLTRKVRFEQSSTISITLTKKGPSAPPKRLPASLKAAPY